MEGLLKGKGLSQTPFRLDILKIFEKHKNAIPLTIIEEELGTYDRITLYRTMKSFLEKGVIHEIAIQGQEKNYAVCMDECSMEDHQHEHIHFRCNECNTTSCISIASFPEIVIPNYKIDQLEIQAMGICENCSQ